MSKLTKTLAPVVSVGGGAAIVGTGIYYSTDSTHLPTMFDEEVQITDNWKPVVDFSNYGVFNGTTLTQIKDSKLNKNFGVFLSRTDLDEKEVWEKRFENLKEFKNSASSKLDARFEAATIGFSENETTALNKICETFAEQDFLSVFYKKESTTSYKNSEQGFQKTVFENFWQFCTYLEEPIYLRPYKEEGDLIYIDYWYYLPDASEGKNKRFWEIKSEIYERLKANVNNTSEITEITTYWNQHNELYASGFEFQKFCWKATEEKIDAKKIKIPTVLKYCSHWDFNFKEWFEEDGYGIKNINTGSQDS